MPKMTASSVAPRKRRLASFTLVELLMVMTIILILAALILGAGSGAMKKAARSRASGEIQAMSTALEGYKIDNGIYPVASFLTGPPAPGAYPFDPVVANVTAYQNSSQALYLALSGQASHKSAQ